MENFITGYPGCEFQIREALQNVLGEEKAIFFLDKVSPDTSLPSKLRWTLRSFWNTSSGTTMPFSSSHLD